jgi:hypothetical protein
MRNGLPSIPDAALTLRKTGKLLSPKMREWLFPHPNQRDSRPNVRDDHPNQRDSHPKIRELT